MEGGRASPQRRRDETKNPGETGTNKGNGRGKNGLGKDRKKMWSVLRGFHSNSGGV